MRTSVRLWRNAAGGLVREGRYDAVSLAYGEDDEVENADQAEAVKLQPKRDKAEAQVEGDHTPKADAKPAPKRRPRGAAGK